MLTSLDTAGEKPYEQFVTDEEKDFEIGLPNLKAVRYIPAGRERIDQVVAEASRILVDRLSDDNLLSKNRLKDIIALVEPRFLETHRDSEANLDQRL